MPALTAKTKIDQLFGDPNGVNNENLRKAEHMMVEMFGLEPGRELNPKEVKPGGFNNMVILYHQTPKHNPKIHAGVQSGMIEMEDKRWICMECKGVLSEEDAKGIQEKSYKYMAKMYGPENVKRKVKARPKSKVKRK